MSKAVLVDITKCMGCRSCQVACKEWNELPAETTHFTGAGNPTDLSAKTWTRVDFHEVKLSNGNPAWRTVKNQCMHCAEPACVSVCPVGAMEKLGSGAVAYDDEKCIGCRYCMVACPFSIPSFEWSEQLSLVRKCDFCHDRVDAGRQPACVASCPKGALVFGERDAMLAEAKKRLAAQPQKYIQHVYGETEVGGTSWLYISDVPFAQVGLDENVTKKPLPNFTWQTMTKVPWAMAGVPILLGGLYWYLHRRDELEGQQKGEQE